MRRLVLSSLPHLLLGILAVVSAACSGSRSSEGTAPEATALVLISVDGFRYDYLDRDDVIAPTLRRLVAEGVRAESLVPVIPTKTFPNHYTLVTGLYTESHGVVGNAMYDPEFDAAGTPASFSMGNREAVADGRWWGGEPIWVTAEKQGVPAATLFWPGSEAEIGGVRPSEWLPYEHNMPHGDRVALALGWLDRTDATRPGFVRLYFSLVDSQGHRHGPDAPEVAAAIEDVDRALGMFVNGLEERGLLDQTDLVVVADHGMAETAPERTVYLDDALTIDAHRIMWGEPVGIWTDEPDAVLDSLAALDHVTAYRREDIPARMHYNDHPRIPSVVVFADAGWTVTRRSYAEQRPARLSGGAHGYDNAYPTMGGLFAARGPSFRVGAVTPAFSTVDVYGILTAAMGLDPSPHEGDPAVPAQVLR
ncbi:MAG: ectonucleotide pyrophosphatase/phosphodiesterase [Bacteroidota bacterium]